MVVLARKKSRLQRPSSFNSRYWQSNRRLDQWRLLYLLRLLSSQALQMDLNFLLLEAKRTGGWFSWRENRRRRWIVANSITDPFQLFLRAEYRSNACVSSFLFICTFHSAHQINSARSFFGMTSLFYFAVNSPPSERERERQSPSSCSIVVYSDMGIPECSTSAVRIEWSSRSRILAPSHDGQNTGCIADIVPSHSKQEAKNSSRRWQIRSRSKIHLDGCEASSLEACCYPPF